nr:MAG TPA: Rad50 zinc hook motif [Caudoviricetes sp.]
MARQTITVKRTTRKRTKRTGSGKGTKRCPTCGKFMK